MFKNFHIKFIFRVLLIGGSAILFAFLLANNYYIYAVIAGIVFLFQVYYLLYLVHFTNRKITYFFDAIRNEDFTLHFPERDIIKPFKHLNKSLNRVNNLIQEVHIKKQEQEQFYQEILKNADIGILTINAKGHILFANAKVEELFNYKPLNHLKQLRQIDRNLYTIFEDIRPFDRKLYNLANERENRQLSLKSTQLSLDNQDLLLVVVQDIYKELDEKETDSWVKLIRVLTHEIMNTITPITSISESILNYYQNDNGDLGIEEITEDHIKNTTKGLKVIKEQGSNLMSFVQSYRSFLNVPQPDKKLVPIAGLFEKIKLLNDVSDHEHIQISIQINPPELEIFFDENQISHVLVNICKNAVQALANKDRGLIKLIAGINNKGEKFIRISDNGPGIPLELQSQIFIPFFTTKDSGTGVGLSLSKQILHLHGASLKLYSVPGQDTIFEMIF